MINYKVYNELAYGLQVAIQAEARKVIEKKDEAHMIRFAKKLIALHVMDVCNSDLLIHFCNNITVHYA